MTTATRLDGLTRERLLEFASNRDDAGERAALIDLAGRWKHNWIPLDEIAAAIKAKKMKGDGKRRPKADWGQAVASRPSGKTRFDPKGAAQHAALTSGARSKARPPARAPQPTAAASAVGNPVHDTARHAQIHREIKVRKVTKGGNVSFVAEHSNGVNTVSARIPQQRGMTDHQHRLAAREALAKGIKRDHADRQPAGTARPSTTPPPGLESMTDAEVRHLAEANMGLRSSAARAELTRRAEARAAGSPRKGLNDYSPGAKPTVKPSAPGKLTSASTPDDFVAKASDEQLHAMLADRRYASWRAKVNGELARRANAKHGDSATFSGQTFKVGERVKMKERVPGVGLRQVRGEIVAHHGNGSFTVRKDDGTEVRRIIDDLGHEGKAEAAAEPAAPAAPKKPRKPSALHQEYRTRREEQDRRFEAHTGGGVAAADTHTQEYKDYFGVGDHSTTPQEQRLTFKSFLEERRQGAEYERHPAAGVRRWHEAGRCPR
jgi:hypothetical protein